MSSFAHLHSSARAGIIWSKLKYLLIALILLNVLDAVLTERLIKLDIARESNPFLFGIVGEPAFIVLKVVGVLLCGLILWDIYRRHRRLALTSTSVFVAVYGGIVLWNLRLLIG